MKPEPLNILHKEYEMLFLSSVRNHIATNAIFKAIKQIQILKFAGISQSITDKLPSLLETLADAISAAYTLPAAILRPSRGIYGVRSREWLSEALKTLSAQILQDSENDVRRLHKALAISEEEEEGWESRATLSTALWRAGAAFAILIRSGYGRAQNSMRRDDALAEAYAIARSAIRPDDWSENMPISLESLHSFSAEVDAYEAYLLGEVRKSSALEEFQLRDLRKRDVSAHLIRRLFPEQNTPLMVMCFSS